MPLDPELPTDLLLADLPLTALHELQHDDRPAHCHRSQHHPERRAALALAVAGVDEHQGLRPSQAFGPRIFFERGVGHAPSSIGTPLLAWLLRSDRGPELCAERLPSPR